MGYLLNTNHELSMIYLCAVHIQTSGLPISHQGVAPVLCISAVHSVSESICHSCCQCLDLISLIAEYSAAEWISPLLCSFWLGSIIIASFPHTFNSSRNTLFPGHIPLPPHYCKSSHSHPEFHREHGIRRFRNIHSFFTIPFYFVQTGVPTANVIKVFVSVPTV